MDVAAAINLEILNMILEIRSAGSTPAPVNGFGHNRQNAEGDFRS